MQILRKADEPSKIWVVTELGAPNPFFRITRLYGRITLVVYAPFRNNCCWIKISIAELISWRRFVQAKL